MDWRFLMCCTDRSLAIIFLTNAFTSGDALRKSSWDREGCGGAGSGILIKDWQVGYIGGVNRARLQQRSRDSPPSGKIRPPGTAPWPPNAARG